MSYLFFELEPSVIFCTGMFISIIAFFVYYGERQGSSTRSFRFIHSTYISEMRHTHTRARARIHTLTTHCVGFVLHMCGHQPMVWCGMGNINKKSEETLKISRQDEAAQLVTHGG